MASTVVISSHPCTMNVERSELYCVGIYVSWLAMFCVYVYVINHRPDHMFGNIHLPRHPIQFLLLLKW